LIFAFLMFSFLHGSLGVENLDKFWNSEREKKKPVQTTGVKLMLFCPEAKNSSPLFKFIELWGADLIEWGAIQLQWFLCQSVD
jgi:hypothetical protein